MDLCLKLTHILLQEEIIKKINFKKIPFLPEIFQCNYHCPLEISPSFSVGQKHAYTQVYKFFLEALYTAAF